ncbi:MAG TPA: cupin domain-containing protein [Terriglobia bacterium]|nr:cupin domain-containing protein [Terriglobia bacterium]
MHIRKTALMGCLVLAVAGGWAAGVLAQENGTSPAVTIFDHKQVDAGMAKPNFATLIRGKSGEGSYVVMTASRDKPGAVEVHNLDLDVLYILSGSATFVTGGTTVDAKTTAPNEIRGKSIDGGESHHVSKGDVIVIPHGVPHWFKEVKGEVRYFVVKVH